MPLLATYKLPCGDKNHYPEKLEYLTRKGQAVVFHVRSSKDFQCHLVMPKGKGVEILKTSHNIDDIVNAYESIKLIEEKIVDSNGIFFYKMATDENELRKLLEDNRRVEASINKDPTALMQRDLYLSSPIREVKR
ncbi:hypothetical protein D3P08_03770 [Paenibacillus nanensis]|uniref:Uncharacterized protein n=1 Tax=Paenibacillus nanensis TaxID=393251 RepID=A0A3A1VL90_9BACL|nr:hypothetical protein [Paenibacillus nanensis]RIX59283.1 hypothetical protein D3P08_03770 [Paenibacillus nanensis]